MSEHSGRDQSGRFAPGNRAAKGRTAKRVAAWRQAFEDAVSEADVAAAIRAVVEAAKGGDVAAARLLLDRCLGPTEAGDLLARLEAVEARLEGQSNADETAHAA